LSEKNELIHVLNGLLTAFADTIDEFEAAAEHAHSYSGYAEYERDIEARRRVSRGLRLLVRRLGGEPRAGGTMMGAIKRDLVHWLGGALHGGRLLSRLLEHEEKNLIASATLLIRDAHLPIAVRSELQNLLDGWVGDGTTGPHKHRSSDAVKT